MEAFAQVIEMPKQPKGRRRERGQGRIFKQSHKGKESKYWWIQFYHRGKQIRQSSKSTKLAVAERLLRKCLGESEAGILQPPRVYRYKYDEMRAALIDSYVADGNRWLKRGRDGELYISQLTSLDRFFGGSRGVDINTDRLREFIRKEKERGLANGTINRSLALLRRMFHLAVTGGNLRDIPHFPMLKEAAHRQGFLEYADFMRLRAELPEYIRPVLTLGYCSGMRLGEVLGLRWTNVNFLDREIRLEAGTTKNGDPRNIPLTGELFEMLKIEREKNPSSEFVFTRCGQKIGSFYKAWRKACVAVGLGRWEPLIGKDRQPVTIPGEKRTQKFKLRYIGLIFHDLRRSGIRNLVRAGVPERVCMSISGHRQRQVFDNYNITSGRDLKLAVERLETYLGANSRNGAALGAHSLASAKHQCEGE